MPQFVYEDLVDRVAARILDGSLKPGDKVPSLRGLSRRLNVSMTSVMRAYGVLEDQGYIESRPKSGYFVTHRLENQPIQLNENDAEPCECFVDKGQIIMSFMESLLDPDAYMFGCASPHPSMLPLSKLSRMIGSLCRREEHRILNYAFPPGLEDLRRQITLQAWEHQCTFTAEDVVTTNGCMEALNLSLRAVTKPGDAVLIESPTYFNVLQTLENLGLKAVALPADPQSGIDPALFEHTLKNKSIKACLLIPSFNNPLGCSIPEERRPFFVELASKYQIPIIEDDVYGDIHLQNQRHRTLKSYDRDGWVLLCSSYSKTLSPGLRVGWVASERYSDCIKKLQFMSTLALSSPSQWVVADFLKSGHYRRHLRKMRQTLRQSLCKFSACIADTFPAGTKVSQPQGGFVLWLQLPSHVDSFQLYQRAKAHHISFVPGPLFSARDEYRNYIRLTYAMPFDDEVERKLTTLGQLAKSAT